eukprot:6053760-Prymnesium_polylepis.1
MSMSASPSAPGSKRRRRWRSGPHAASPIGAWSGGSRRLCGVVGEPRLFWKLRERQDFNPHRLARITCPVRAVSDSFTSSSMTMQLFR